MGVFLWYISMQERICCFLEKKKKKRKENQPIYFVYMCSQKDNFRELILSSYHGSPGD